MSKTTQKYGKPTFVAWIRSEIPTGPSERVLWGWKKLDEYSQREFTKNYDNLTDAQKSALHYNINEQLDELESEVRKQRILAGV